MPEGITSPTAIACGPKLKDARIAMGFNLKQVSKNMGFAISTISEIENEKRRVSVVEVNRFAKLYNRPITFFFDEDVASSSFAVLLRVAETAPVERKTIIEFHELCRDYRDLSKLLGAPAVLGPPDYSDSALTTLEQAEELAENERSSLGLNGQPIKEICDLLETKRGIRIFHFAGITNELSGAFAYDQELGPCFLINAEQPQRRRTFTVAHEYAHCIAHRSQLAHIDTTTGFETRNPRDRFANAFAAAFLMPGHTISSVLNQIVSRRKTTISAEMILHIALYFGVSFEAVGWRLLSLKKLRSQVWKELRSEQFASSPTARSLGYSNEVGNPSKFPLQYKYLAHEAYRRKLISFERLSELLQRNYYELREELG